MHTKIKTTVAFLMILLGLTAKAQKVLILDKPINESIVVEAGETVILKPGFSTAPGIEFVVVIDNTPASEEPALGEGYQLNENLNWTSSITYDISGEITSSGISYFNTLGKPTQSQTTDIKTGKIWAAEVLYDHQGRPALQTLSAPVTGDNTTFQGYNSDFTTLSTNEVESITDDNVSLPVINTNSNTLGWYYSNENDSEEYQDITANPYAKTIYSTLNPGASLKTLGGNKVSFDGEEKWLRGFTYTVPSPHEMYYVFGKDHYDGAIVNNEEEVIAKVVKTVMIDVQGNETVVFTDIDGKTLAAARSGGTKKYEIVSLIGEQGFVDVHIPKGIVNNEIQFLDPGTENYLIYDLRTEKVVNQVDVVGGNIYRISLSPQPEPKSFIDATGNITISDNPKGIRYPVNYCDYSLNYYDKAGRLTASLQPNGFNDTCLNSIQATVSHDLGFISTFEYNSLGQLLSTTSPDEGTAYFKYRKDGQIRFSQNSKQAAAIPKEFSYTNYDKLSRPVESGVYTEDTISFENVDSLLENILGDITVDDDGLPNASCKEQHFTLYDSDDVSGLHIALSDESIATSNYPAQKFLAGNVSKTYTNKPNTTTTWYSYDIYGRVEWLVQQIEGLGTKTIDYEYDPVTSEVTKVCYQKHIPEETFIHKYDYNVAGQLVNVETSTNGTDFTDQARYEYYETGALKRVELADNLQGLDYVYNLAGQLKAINSPNIGTTDITVFRDPGKDGINGLRQDVFGMEIDYHYKDYSRGGENIPDNAFIDSNHSGNRFDGNIGAIRWNTDDGTGAGRIGDFQNAYGYYYNDRKWLQDAVFYMPNFITDEEKLLGYYNYYTYYLYDANGNITYLQRAGFDEDAPLIDYTDYHLYPFPEIDYLMYDYQDGNKLDHVDDLAPEVTNANDIKDQEPGNYTYNEIGQLTNNAEEGISYAYNASGLVTEVQKDNLPLVKFYYSDKGQRERKESFDTSGTLVSTTHYVRDASGTVMSIYTNGVQQEIPVYGASRLGVYYKQADNTIYQLTDHLCNVRALVSKDQDHNLVFHGNTDYYPGGMAMPGRNNQSAEGYRYGYQSEFAELDEETGLNAFQIRLYDSRINRWLTTDPYGQYFSPYVGMGNDWVNGVDPDGGWKTKAAQLLAWARNGFRGELFTSDVATGDGKYGISFDEAALGEGKNDFTGTFLVTSRSGLSEMSSSRQNGWSYDKNGEGFFHGTISSNSPNVFETMKNIGNENQIPFTNTIYQVADEVSVFTTSFTNVYPRNLDGSVAQRGSSEMIDKALNGYITVLPMPNPIKGFNIIQSNKFFKGTMYNKLAPKTKGAILRYFNRMYKFFVKPKTGIKQVKENSAEIQHYINTHQQ